MEDRKMSLAQLEKLAKNPHYKMSQKQLALLEQYRAQKFKNNHKFQKHPTKLVDTDNGKSDSN